MSLQKNFIKKLPDGENLAKDESLMWLQFRIRKGTDWEKLFKAFIEDALNENCSDEFAEWYGVVKEKW